MYLVPSLRWDNDIPAWQTLFILMDSPIHTDTIRMGWSIVYCKRSQIKISKEHYIFVLLFRKQIRHWGNAAFCGISSKSNVNVMFTVTSQNDSKTLSDSNHFLWKFKWISFCWIYLAFPLCWCKTETICNGIKHIWRHVRRHNVNSVFKLYKNKKILFFCFCNE